MSSYRKGRNYERHVRDVIETAHDGICWMTTRSSGTSQRHPRHAVDLFVSFGHRPEVIFPTECKMDWNVNHKLESERLKVLSETLGGAPVMLVIKSPKRDDYAYVIKHPVGLVAAFILGTEREVQWMFEKLGKIQ